MARSAKADVVEERDRAVENAVVELLNVAIVVRRNDCSTVVELECRMCGQREENHTEACPVPVLEEWINPPED